MIFTMCPFLLYFPHRHGFQMNDWRIHYWDNFWLIGSLGQGYLVIWPCLLSYLTLIAELWLMVLSGDHILDPVWVGGTISSLNVDQPGVPDPWGPYGAWWSPPMVLHSCDSDSPNEPLTRACKILQGNIYIWASNALKVRFLESLGPYGAWWSLPMDMWTTFLGQWFSKCTARYL